MTTTSTNNSKIFQIKSMVARILAAENLHVRHDPTSNTAYFDVKGRVLSLPVWQNISEALYNMLVVHEVGHALYTPSDGWTTVPRKIAAKCYSKPSIAAENAVRMFLNVVEDARIDRLQKDKFPGTKFDYVEGYKELHSRNFFGIKNKDVNTLTFIDKANLYYKGGYLLGLAFNKQEKQFIDRMNTTMTFDEVAQLTEDIFKYAKEQEPNLDQLANSTISIGIFCDDTEDSDDGEEASADDFDVIIDNRTESDSGEETDAKDKSSGDKSNKENSEDKSDQNGGKSGEGSGSKGDKSKKQSGKGIGEDDEKNDSKSSAESGDSAKETATDENSGSKEKVLKNKKPLVVKKSSNAAGNDTVSETFIPSSLTEETVNQNLKSLSVHLKQNYVYVTTPIINLKNVVDDWTVTIPRLKSQIDCSISKRNFGGNGTTLETSLSNFNAWKAKEKDTITYMIKEFEMHKAADTYARTAISKTGMLDMNKIFSYHYNDDIFKRQKEVPKGKSHGLIMFIDWSGSMEANLKHTIKQLLTLVMFCKRVGIPFEVYLFRTAHEKDFSNKYGYYANDTYRADQYSIRPGDLRFGTFKLCNILSSRMNTTQFNKAMGIIWACGDFRLHQDQLNSTPLNQSIIAAEALVREFQKKTRVQIASAVFLTDGGSDIYQGYEAPLAQNRNTKYYNDHLFVEDKETKKVYDLNGAYSGDMTNGLIQLLKDRTGCKTIGFYLHSGTVQNIPFNILNSSAPGYDKAALETFWKKEKYIPSKTTGYDEYFVLDVAAFRNTDQKLKVDSNMTEGEMQKAILNYTSGKTINRSLLSRFIAQIATEEKVKG